MIFKGLVRLQLSRFHHRSVQQLNLKLLRDCEISKSSLGCPSLCNSTSSPTLGIIIALLFFSDENVTCTGEIRCSHGSCCYSEMLFDFCKLGFVMQEASSTIGKKKRRLRQSENSRTSHRAQYRRLVCCTLTSCLLCLQWYTATLQQQ